MSDIYNPTDHQVTAKVGAIDKADSPQIILNEPAILAIRADLLTQADYWMTEAHEAWINVEGDSFDPLWDLAFKLGMARSNIQALAELAPTHEGELPDA